MYYIMKHYSYGDGDPVANRLSKANAEKEKSELLRLEVYAERRNELNHILKMLSNTKPEFNIEILKKASFLGSLAMRPSFTIGEYFYGEDGHNDTRVVIDEVVRGWHFKNVIERPPMFDQSSSNFDNLTISSDGRNWLGGGVAFGAEVPTIGVLEGGNVLGGNGHYLESQEEIHLHNPSMGDYLVGNVSAVISGLKNIQNK